MRQQELQIYIKQYFDISNSRAQKYIDANYSTY